MRGVACFSEASVTAKSIICCFCAGVSELNRLDENSLSKVKPGRIGIFVNIVCSAARNGRSDTGRISERSCRPVNGDKISAARKHIKSQASVGVRNTSVPSARSGAKRQNTPTHKDWKRFVIKFSRIDTALHCDIISAVAEKIS